VLGLATQDALKCRHFTLRVSIVERAHANGLAWWRIEYTFAPITT
jgi:hypothetical protein